MPSILQVNNVCKDFLAASWSGFRKFRIQALSNVSCQINQGDCLAILGPNGAGKTTLLKIIATLVLPDAGEVWLDHFQLGQDDSKIKSLIGLAASEERSFYWRLTGRQNLELFAALYGLGRKTAQERIKILSTRFQIDFLDKRFDILSTGMQRKMALLRALLHDPKILLLDEPTKSLDYTSARELREFIRQEAGCGRTIVLTTHDIAEAESLAHNFLFLKQGQVLSQGTLDNIRQKQGMRLASLSDLYLELTRHDQ
jgi:ABC-2 type transport system ATP-binding protein